MYYWTKKIEKLTEENKYLKHRIEEVGSAYYLLKISHDELEKNYILKPFSIREVLREIKDLINSSKDGYELFLTLLKNLFKLEKAGLYIKENNAFILKSALGENNEIDLDDPLIKEALESYTISYIGHLYDKKSNYLAVIPIISLTKELKGIFVVEEIPFFSLTKDNLIAISLFLTYFINMVNIVKDYKDMALDPFISKEIETLRLLSINYTIENYVVIFYIRDKMEKAYIQKYLRGSDIYFEYLDKLVVILPLTSSLGVMKFIDRLNKDNQLMYRVVDLKEATLEDIKRMLDEYRH
jgi:sugar-specific transcriptional regulator TrmB